MRALFIALALAPVAASAHVTLEPGTAAANQAFEAVLNVAHGCDGAATTAVSVALPNGFLGAEPVAKPGWTAAVATGPYDMPYQLGGEVLAEGPREITWSGGSLEDGEDGAFVVRGTVADLATGTRLPFAVTQRCGEVSVEWNELTAEGQDAKDLAHPAPVLTVSAAEAGAAPVGSASVAALSIEAAWTRATPPGADVAAGYLTITNAGAEPDRLVGGTVPFAAEVQVHQMIVKDGMMQMSEIPGGLEIAPGETVTFAPGGNHLMFLGLTAAPKAGATVPVTLRFERAGEVMVEMPVAPLGAMTPPKGSGGHSHAH